jgi:hypothetical protein
LPDTWASGNPGWWFGARLQLQTRAVLKGQIMNAQFIRSFRPSVRSFARPFAVVGGVALAGASHAATDLALVTAAQTDALAVAAALTAMAVAVWAAMYIKRKFFG